MVPSLAGESDGGGDLFFTEILILSKYSEDISAHARRINTSQLQCKNRVCLLFFFFFFGCISFPFDCGGPAMPMCVFLSIIYVQIMLKKRFPLPLCSLTPCIVQFSLCPCLSLYSHFTICNLPLSRAMFSPHSLHLLWLTTYSAKSFLKQTTLNNLDRGKLVTEVTLAVPSSLIHHKHADFNRKGKLLHFHLFFAVSDSTKHYE